MLTVTGRQVWLALRKDPDVAKYCAKAKRAIRLFAETTPEVLKDFLAEPVTVASLQRAQVAVFHYALKCHLGKALVKAQHGTTTSRRFQEGLIRRYEDSLVHMVNLGSVRAIDNIPRLLKESGMTERDFLRHPKPAGLSGETLRLYDEGKLTINDLLKLQPEVIIKCI